MTTKKPAPLAVGARVTGRTHRGTPIAGRVVEVVASTSGLFARVKLPGGTIVSTRPSLLQRAR